jgi:hypothetical protein
VESYQPISLLQVMSKLFEKQILKNLKLIIAEKHLVPTHQFGFRKNHSTKTRCIVSSTSLKTFENKGVCSGVLTLNELLTVWHRGLLHILRSVLPDHFCQLLKSCLNNRHFRVKHEDSYSELKLIKAGVPQGSILGPVLYLLYINDVPAASNSTMATYGLIPIFMFLNFSKTEFMKFNTKKCIWTGYKDTIW